MSSGLQPLTPPKTTSDGEAWTVLARNRRVNRTWEALMERAPETTRTCYEHLRDHPTKRVPRRVYPLRGKRYRGVWGYEVTGGDRVYYVPDLEEQTVLVYYADEHPDRIPLPPD